MAKKDFNKETLDKVHDWAFQDAEDKTRYYFHVACERNAHNYDDGQIWFGGKGSEHDIATMLMDVCLQTPKFYDVLLTALRYTRKARKYMETQNNNDPK